MRNCIKVVRGDIYNQEERMGEKQYNQAET